MESVTRLIAATVCLAACVNATFSAAGTGLALLSFSLVAGASSPPEHADTGRLGARRASSPARTTVPIKTLRDGEDGRRDSHSATGTTTISGHSCTAKHVNLYLKEGQSLGAGTCGSAGWCNSWSTDAAVKNCTAEGAVCYSPALAYCSVSFRHGLLLEFVPAHLLVSLLLLLLTPSYLLRHFEFLSLLEIELVLCDPTSARRATARDARDCRYASMTAAEARARSAWVAASASSPHQRMCLEVMTSKQP